MDRSGAATMVPAGWPIDRPMALSISVMLEGWTDDATPGLGPMGNPLKAGAFDTQAKSWAEYGPKTGAWRLLDALDDLGCKAVFYVSGILAGRYPELMRAIVGQGHVVAAHAWGQNILPIYQSRAEEHADLRRCIAELERHSGMRPRGWISPRATPSLVTPELLAEEGVLWYVDVFDRDTPYLLATPKGSVVAIPFAMEVNDFPLSVRYGNQPEAFTRVLSGLLAGWQELRQQRACVDATVHAHVFGRPAGIIAFKAAVRQAQARDFVWITHHARLADLYAPT